MNVPLTNRAPMMRDFVESWASKQARSNERRTYEVGERRQMPSLRVHRVDEFPTGYSWQVALRQSLLPLTDRSYDSKKNARWHRRKLYMKVLRSLLLGFFGLSMLAGNCQLSPNVSAADLFSKIRCGTDIPKALIGGFMTNERVVSIEARHKDLGLKDLGGSELTGDLFLSSWLICGNEYELIMDKRSIVRDVLQFPQHSKASPEFIGSCRVNGKELPEDIVAVLNNQVGAENLSAKFAWKIDPRKAKFVKLATEGMQCPRSGVVTADGGN